LGKRIAIGDGVGDVDLILQCAVSLFGVERLADAPARRLRLVGAEPFRHQFDDHIGDRSGDRNHQDYIGPRPEPPGFDGMDDKSDIDREQYSADERHRVSKKLHQRATE
jgi:hypothetical protein